MNNELKLKFDNFFNEISNEDYTYFLENYIPEKMAPESPEWVAYFNYIP